MRLLILLFFTPAILAHPNLFKRHCLRSNAPAARTVCELFLEPGTNEARKCERLVQEIAALNCVCPETLHVVYNKETDHGWCTDSNNCYVSAPA